MWIRMYLSLFTILWPWMIGFMDSIFFNEASWRVRKWRAHPVRSCALLVCTLIIVSMCPINPFSLDSCLVFHWWSELREREREREREHARTHARTHARIRMHTHTRALTHDACTHTHDHARTHAHAHTLTWRKHADAHTCMCTRFGTGNHRRAGGPKVNEGRHKLSVKPFETNGNTQCRLGRWIVFSTHN